MTTPHLVHAMREPVRRDRLLRLPEVETATGLKKSTVYLPMSRSEFPRCVQLTARCVAWPESQVFQWVQDRIAAAPQQRPAGASGGTTAAQGGDQ